MFDRLFGDGQELQFNRLKVMVPVSLVLVMAMVIYGMFGMLILSCAFGVVIMVLGMLRFIYLLVIRASRKAE